MKTFALIAVFAAGVEMTDVSTLNERWVIDIRYATTDNFTGQVLYPVGKCLLRAEVAQMLVKTQAYLDTKHAGYAVTNQVSFRSVCWSQTRKRVRFRFTTFNTR